MAIVLAQTLNGDPSANISPGDLDVDETGIRLVSGAEATIVLVSNACRQQPGEDLLQPERGIPLEMLLGKGASAQALRGVYMRKIAATSTVTSIPTCKTTIVNDTATLDIEVSTVEGAVPLTFSIGVSQ